MAWKPAYNRDGDCINNPCDHCKGTVRGTDGKTYTCDDCPVLED